MSMAQPTDWLAALVEGEVRAVIAWKRAAQQTPEVKPDHDSRFSDDGSNFRSVIVSSSLPADSNVQISSVVSPDDPVTLLITDGFSRVKAKLSEKALAKLEDEIGEKIDYDLKGDVLRIREATVESTPYGPTEGFIQLAIDDLDYLFHIRKTLGQPVAVGDRVEIRQLVAEIETLRCPLEEDSRGFTPHPSSAQRAAVASQTKDRLDIGDTPKSQRSARLSQSDSPSFRKSLSTQLAPATQVPARQKTGGPTLESDGLEIEAGVNLSRPIERRNQRASPTVIKSPVVTNDTGKKLLSLLGKRKAEPDPEPATKSTEALQTQLPPATDLAREIRAESPAIEPNSELENVATVPKSPSLKKSAPTTRTRPDYRIRKIPRDQQKLLDRQSSWLPSLPGQQFPHPNVPIELLNKWKSQTISEAEKKTLSTALCVESDDPTIEGADIIENPNEAGTSESPSSASSSDDEEIPGSQWPPTPEQQRPRLPPDSSMGHSSRPSTADKQAGPLPTLSKNPEISPQQAPYSSIHLASQHSPLVVGRGMTTAPTKLNDLSSNNTPTKNRSPIPLPQRPDWIPHSRPAPSSARRRFSSGPIVNLDGSTSRPSTSEDLLTEAAPARANVPSSTTSPQGSKFSPQVAATQDMNVVKARQTSRNEDEDGLEMAVPRSLGQDPAVAHRQRRREYLLAEQRRSWITKNLESTSEKPTSFIIIYGAYKKAHEKDAVKGSEFAEVIEEVFPAEDGAPAKLILRSLKSSPHVQSSLAQPPGTPTTDTIGAVATSEPRPSVHALNVTPLISSQTRRSLPWANTTQSTPRLEPSVSGTKAVPNSTAPASYGTSSELLSTQKGAASGKGAEILKNPPEAQMAGSQFRRPPVTHHPATQIGTSNVGRNGLLSQPRRPAIQSSNSAVKTSQTGQTRSITTVAPAQREPIPAAESDGMEVDEARNKQQDISVLAEFARAYRALEPGGAFTEKRVANRAKEKERREAPRLDVLSWKL